MHTVRVAAFWLVLGLLAAFVIFVQYIADVGGSHDGLSVPPPVTTTPAPSPVTFDQRVAGELLLEFEHDLGVVVAQERALGVVSDPRLLRPPA